MSKCKYCTSSQLSHSTLKEYNDDLLGIPFKVTLLNSVEQQSCMKCKRVLGHKIPNLQGLYAAIAILRVVNPTKLNGAEIKFLRRCVGWRAKELAKKLTITAEHLSRCENGHVAFGESHEQLLRSFIVIKMIDCLNDLPVSLEKLKELPNIKINPMRDLKNPMAYFLKLEAVGECCSEKEPRWEGAPSDLEAA
jgi:transcriptional regulator with XRE-family HTH domain